MRHVQGTRVPTRAAGNLKRSDQKSSEWRRQPASAWGERFPGWCRDTALNRRGQSSSVRPDQRQGADMEASVAPRQSPGRQERPDEEEGQEEEGRWQAGRFHLLYRRPHVTPNLWTWPCDLPLNRFGDSTVIQIQKILLLSRCTWFY